MEVHKYLLNEWLNALPPPQKKERKKTKKKKPSLAFKTPWFVLLLFQPHFLPATLGTGQTHRSKIMPLYVFVHALFSTCLLPLLSEALIIIQGSTPGHFFWDICFYRSCVIHLFIPQIFINTQLCSSQCARALRESSRLILTVIQCLFILSFNQYLLKAC